MANLRYETLFHVELAHPQYPQANRSPFQLEATLPCEKLLLDYKLFLHQSAAGFSIAAPIIENEPPYTLQFPFLQDKVKLSFALFNRQTDFYESFSLPVETPGRYLYYLNNFDATEPRSQFMVNHDSVGPNLRLSLSPKVVSGEIVGDQAPTVFDVMGDDVSLSERISVEGGHYALDLQHLSDGAYRIVDGNGERDLYLCRPSFIRRAPVAIIDIYCHQAVDANLQAVRYVPFIDESGIEQVRQTLQYQDFAVHFGPYHHAPIYMANYVTFTDTGHEPGYIEGKVIIAKADNERTISHYALYWGESADRPLSGQPPIALLPATGFDLTYTFDMGTERPYGASHLLVYTQCRGLEMAVGVSASLIDILPEDLILWLDAHDPWSRQQSNGSIQQWDDKSGNGHHAQQSLSSSRPATNIDTQYARNLISFDGIDDHLRIDHFDFAASGVYSIICVLKTADLSHDESVFSSFTEEGRRSSELILTRSGKIELEIGYFGDTHELAGHNTWRDNSFALLSIISDGTTIRLFHNREWQKTVNESVPAANHFYLGKGIHQSHSRHWGNHQHLFHGAIGEFFIYARALPEEERESQEIRLMQRWGIFS